MNITTFLLKLLKVINYIWVALKSALERFADKDAACKAEVFLRTLFLENKEQMDQKKYGTMLFVSKKVGLTKISLILQKMKINPKPDRYTPFLHEGPQYKT